MTRDEIETRVTKWLDKIGQETVGGWEQNIYHQECADRLFAEIDWTKASATNIAMAIAANSELASALDRRPVAAIAMLVFTLNQIVGSEVIANEIVLSREIDTFHPPVFYILADRVRNFAPVDLEIRIPLTLPDSVTASAYAFLVARPSDIAQPGNLLSQAWDRDVRIVLPANRMPDMSYYRDKFVAELSL